MPDQVESQKPPQDPYEAPAKNAQTASITKQNGVVGQTGDEDPNKAIAETRKELHWLEKANFTGQIVLAAVGIVALVIYHGQLTVMQNQLNQMKASGQTASDQTWRIIDNMNWLAKEMQKSVEESASAIDSSRQHSEAAIRAAQEQNRPWIEIVDLQPRKSACTGLSLNFVDTSMITNQISQVSFTGILTIKNVGRSVAVNSTIAYELVFSRHAVDDTDDLLKEQRAFCRSFYNGAIEPSNPPVLMFPEKPYAADVGDGKNIRKENLGRSETIETFIRSAIVGCVNYRSTFSGKLYQSGFMFDIAHANDDGPGYESFLVGRGVPMNALTLIRIAAADYAK